MFEFGATSAQVSQSDRKPYSAIGGNGLGFRAPVRPQLGHSAGRAAASSSSTVTSRRRAMPAPTGRRRGEGARHRVGLVLAGHQEHDLPGTVHYGNVRVMRTPRKRHPGRLDTDHGMIAFAQRVVAREQRAGVSGPSLSRIRSALPAGVLILALVFRSPSTDRAPMRGGTSTPDSRASSASLAIRKFECSWSGGTQRSSNQDIRGPRGDLLVGAARRVEPAADAEMARGSESRRQPRRPDRRRP